MFKTVPLSSSFVIVSILGLLFTLLYVYPLNAKWGTAFFVVFLCMLIASFVSMSNANTVLK